MNDNLLLLNLDKLHSTELGIKRIKNNLSLEVEDTIQWCKNEILKKEATILKRGKNWYVYISNFCITINSYSYTIITAHKEKN